MSRICDARYHTDDDGRVGYISAIVENVYGTVSVPVGECSDDVMEVWHGMSSPAYVCGKHWHHGVAMVAFKGHRNRLKGVEL